MVENPSKMVVFHGISWYMTGICHDLYPILCHQTWDIPPKKMEKIWGNDGLLLWQQWGNSGNNHRGDFYSGDVHEILMTWKITIYWWKMMMNPLMEWVPIFKHALKYYMLDPVMGVEIENLQVKHRATLSSTTYMCVYIYHNIYIYILYIHIYIYIHTYIHIYICCICC